MRKNECFKVDISIQDFPPLVDSNKKTIKRVDAGRWYSIGDPAWVVADPFLFVHRGEYFASMKTSISTTILVSLR